MAPWAGPAPVDGVGVDVSDAARSDAITVTGVFERLALDAARRRRRRRVTRYSVRTDERSWLDGITGPLPAAGSVDQILGTPADEFTLAVDDLRVIVAAAAGSELAQAPRSTRVLVIRAFWTSRPPAQPSTATTRRRVITDAGHGSARSRMAATPSRAR